MLLKTGACFTNELELNCPTVVACVAALPTGLAAAAGDLVLGKDGKYHALPAAPAPQTLSLAGNTVTLSGGGGSITVPDLDTQDLSLVGNVLSLTNGGSVTLPSAPGQVAQTLSIAGSTVSLSGGGGSIVLPAAASVTFATPAETIAGTSTTLAVNPADLVARENIPAQTGLNVNVALIPAPTASQSPWGANTLGETLHYAPGLGWKIVEGRYGATVSLAANFTPTPGTIANFPGMAITMPRAGKATFTLSQLFNGFGSSAACYLMLNGSLISRFGGVSTVSTDPAFSAVDISGAVTDITVAAGDIFSVSGQWQDHTPAIGTGTFNTSLSRFSAQYN